jgi:putative ABC transport system ATP-binding protein
VVIELRGVSKWYCRGDNKTQVLDAVDLVVRTGECTFLMGPSGSGKTTLLSIIGCVLTADAGHVSVLGHDVSRLSSSKAALLRRDSLGFIFQKFHLIRGLTAQDNVSVPMLLAGVPTALAKRRALELLDQVGLADQSRSQPGRMSVGQCQRVAFARALACDPELILADEPTASLDAEAGQRAMQLLRELTVQSGKTVIVVTHDYRILPFADRTIQVSGGMLREDAAPGSDQLLDQLETASKLVTA